MGRDKALLEIGGAPLIVRTARMLEDLVGAPTIIGPPERYAALRLRVVADDRPGLGPLGGVVTALRVTRYEWNLILGCDMPFLSPAWLEHLIRRALCSNVEIVLPVRERGLEPLCAMYAWRCEPPLSAALGRGERTLTDAVRKLRAETIPPNEWKVFDAEGLLFENINRPGDYESAKQKEKK